MLFRIALLLLCISTASRTHASDWVMDFAYSWGGGRLLTVDEYDAYDDRHSDTVRAGSGFSASIGKMLSIDDEVGLQLNAGYKADGLWHTETSATFDRWTFDAMAWAFVTDIRFGLGATYEVNPELDLTDLDEGVEQFENAEGLFGQIDTMLTRNLMVGARFTAIEYESQDFLGEKVNGDNLSVRLTWWF